MREEKRPEGRRRNPREMAAWRKRRRWYARVLWFAAGVCAAVLVTCILTGAGKHREDRTEQYLDDSGAVTASAEHQVQERKAEPSGTDTAPTAPEAPDSAAQGSEEEWREAAELLLKEPQLLVLVNDEEELDPEYDGALRDICKGRLQASSWLYDDLVELLAAADDEGYTYWVASAWRSRERQEELMEEEIQKYTSQGYTREQALERSQKTLMLPGHSEHETGLALDLLCSGNMNMDLSQADEPANQWLREHAWEYGFVLRYPAEKTEVTRISYEPWHFRYVGREAARFLHEEELTLEEFHEWAALGASLS